MFRPRPFVQLSKYKWRCNRKVGIEKRKDPSRAPGKDLVHSRSACRQLLQGDPPGYWLLERAQQWVESEGGRLSRKEDCRQSQDIASRKVAGSNLGAGKVFLTQNFH